MLFLIAFFFFHRNNSDFLISLGQTLVNFSRIIPGGTLVFFPSYPFLDQCVNHWQGCNIWASITKNKVIQVRYIKINKIIVIIFKIIYFSHYLLNQKIRMY